MQTFRDFCEWAGSQREAARRLGVDESTVSRACHSRPSIELAKRAERVSGGHFLAAAMLGLLGASSEPESKVA